MYIYIYIYIYMEEIEKPSNPKLMNLFILISKEFL